jgi:STE24 endopeptidase
VSSPPLRLGRGRRERVLPWAVVAVLLAIVGVVASVWRPLAPSLAAVATDLDTFGPDVMTAVDAYRAPRYLVAGVSTGLGVVVPVLIAWTRRGRALVGRVAGPATQSPLRGALVAVVVAVATSLATLPLAAWIRIVHDGRWGFRTQSWSGWVVDWVTVSAGTWLTMGALAALLLAAVRRWPRSWPYRLTVVGALLGAAIVVIHPLVLQPVLLPTSPLPEGEVRDVAEELMAEMGAEDLPLYVGEASVRTTRVNALVTGLGPTERIVLYDTLLELPEDQLRSVIAHELAHREHRDLLRGVLAVPTALLAALLLLRGVVWSSPSRRRAGARGPTDPRLVAVVMAVAAVLEFAGTPVANMVSRRAEAAADHRALQVTGEVEVQIRTARAFTVRDLSAPEPPAWAQLLYGTHPSVAERVRAAVAEADDPDDLPGRDELSADEADVAHPSITDGPP